MKDGRELYIKMKLENTKKNIEIYKHVFTMENELVLSMYNKKIK